MDLYLGVSQMYCGNTANQVLNNSETWNRHPNVVQGIPAPTADTLRLSEEAREMSRVILHGTSGGN
jgi:hypothetical protein